MKHYILKITTISLFLFSLNLHAQTGNVGVGTSSPNASAKLDVNASDKGVLLPQVDLQGLDDDATIANPATSLLVWNTGATWGDAAYYYNSGTSSAPNWNKVLGGDDTGMYESGEAIMPNGSITPGNTVYTDIVSVTLPAAGKYRLTAQVRSGLVASAYVTYGLAYPNTASGAVVSGTEGLAQFIGPATTFQGQGTSTWLVDASAAGTYTLRAISNSNSATVTSSSVGSTRLTWEKIADLLPVSPSYETGIAKFYNSTTQTSIPNGTNVTLNTTEANSISSYVSMSSGVITLEPGTYELTGSVGGINPTGSGGARMWSGFYNITTSSYIGQGGHSASGNAGNFNGAPYNASNAVITVTATTEIVLRVNSNIGTSTISSPSDYADASLGRAWVSVKKYN